MKKFGNYIRRRFITGMLTILPMGITIWIFMKIFNVIDSILGTFIYRLLGRRIPGLGMLITILLIIEVGVLTNNILGKKITTSLENLFLRLPVIKTIYGPIKDVLSNLTKKDSNNFKKAVFVTYPMEGSHSIGFVTKDRVLIDGEEKTVIFIPTTPNPTSGFLVYLSKDKYLELDIPVDLALKTIVSLGTISPDIIEKAV